jgi:hypothetical protein
MWCIIRGMMMEAEMVSEVLGFFSQLLAYGLTILMGANERDD